jgi:hypothetical protein
MHVAAIPAPPPLQASPVSQAMAPAPPQQAWPMVPHAVHMAAAPIAPAVQRAPAPVQVPTPPPAQQGSPTEPQAMPMFWHEPFVHMPRLPPQVAPLARHIPPAQQPPASQVLAAQQA